MSIQALAAGFQNPPPSFQPIPFWWWTGERLDLDRLAWELDQLQAKGISSAVISYNHHPDGAPDVGDPPVYSKAWWELLGQVLALCEARGMTLGFQDYCLLKPRLAEISAAHPDVRGAELRHTRTVAPDGATVNVGAPEGARILEAIAFPSPDGAACRNGCIDLTETVAAGQAWTAPKGVWTIITCYASPAVYDPLHPQSGALALENFYGAYERRLPGALGRTLTVSFQDELDFGGRFPLWSDGLPQAFLAEKGYSLAGRLAELFISLDAQTPKFRLDFHDVSNTLADRGWFEPVYRWHEARGLLFGHDNAGRGAIAVGGAYYGDTMRAMRWYSAPGSDDPNLNGPRAFKGIKVASSIAHLYARPRVWAECFHSSGWGVAPAKVRDGLNALFALGATVVNLHGLYYSTRAGWWEWAPPDFHFRQPYWSHSGQLNAYTTRLSWALAQGRHTCDVAIFYPSEAVACGLNPSAGPELLGARSLSEAQRNDPDYTEDLAEALTFAAGEALFKTGVDFDFVDSASLARSRSLDGRLEIGDASYRVIVLAEATAMPWAALQAVLAFSRAGGQVVIVARPPVASDRAGADDPELEALVAELQSRAIQIASIGPQFAQTVLPVTDRTLAVAGGPAHVLHRRVDGLHLIYVYNPSEAAAALDLTLPAGVSAVERWAAETGERQTYPVHLRADGRLHIDVALEALGATLFVASKSLTSLKDTPALPVWRDLLRLGDSEWRSAILPTLDNRFADFQAPPSVDRIGPTCGRMWSWRPESAAVALTSNGCMDLTAVQPAEWTQTKPGIAPRMLLAGPFPADADLSLLDARVTGLDPLAPQAINLDGALYPWRDYSFSLETGIDEDPVQKSWDSGPHGLKGAVPDEFIDLLADEPGAIFYLMTSIWAPDATEIDLVASSRAAHGIFLDGDLVIEQPLGMAPGVRSEWRLPHYDATPRARRIAVGPQGRRLVMRLVQPEGQRIRAYVAPDAPKLDEPRLRWFANPGAPKFRLSDAPERCETWFRLRGPPGLRALSLRHVGEARVWVDQQEAQRQDGAPDGVCCFVLGRPTLQSEDVLIQVMAAKAVAAGDLISEPVAFTCEDGAISLGDWTAHGLEAYSGVVSYKTEFDLSPEALQRPLAVALGDVSATCEVRLNGVSLGFLMGPPWRLPLGDAARPGVNQLDVIVANTLVNFYAYNRPTPYASKDDTRSGLFGPIRVLIAD